MRTSSIIALFALSTVGCYFEPLGVPNGLDGNLELDAPEAIAVGESAPLLVQHTKGTNACLTLRTSNCNAYPDDDERVLEIVSASCTEGCSVDVGAARFREVGELVVPVTSVRAGRATVTVRVRLENGREVEDRYPLDFYDATAIEVMCDDAYSCRGVDSVLSGAHLAWDVVPIGVGPDGERVPLWAHLEGESSGPLEVELESELDSRFSFYVTGHRVSIGALGPGEAAIALRAGGVERTVPVSIASPDEVVGGAVMVSPTALNERVRLEDALSGLTALPTQLWIHDPADRRFDGDPSPSGSGVIDAIVVLELEDGTHGIGPTGPLSLDDESVAWLRTDPYSPSLLDLSLRAPGSFTIRGAVGRTDLSWSFVVVDAAHDAAEP